MALDRTAETGRVNFGSGATLDNLAQGTMLFWMEEATGAVDDGYPYFKGDAVNYDLQLYCSAAGNLQLARDRAAVNLQIVVNAYVGINAWQFFGIVWDSAGANGDQKMFRGTLMAVATEAGAYATQLVGAGALSDDSAKEAWAFNGEALAGWSSWGERMAWLGIWNTPLSLGQIRAQQFRPHITPGCVLFSHFGFNGVAQQADWSGNGNNGAVVNMQVQDHVPLGPFFGYDLGPAGLYTSVGGVLYFKSVGGVFAPTGALRKKTSKDVAGVLTPSGTLGTSYAVRQAAAGTLAPSGTLTTVQTFVQGLAGALTMAGTLATTFTAGPGLAIANAIGKVLAGIRAAASTLGHPGIFRRDR